MSTTYFILSKTASTNISDNSQNQIVVLNPQSENHVLPKTNLDYYVKHGLFEKNLIEWCKQFCNPQKIFLDIGAHSGTYSISLARLSKQVYAFEPQRMTYYALCGSTALSGMDNIYCMNVGLGSPEQTGRQSLKIVSNDGGGSSLHSTVGVLREEIINLVTLDSLELSSIGFIKMDVEENELFVLQGGLKTLERSGWPSILFESNDKNVELFQFIKKQGYQIKSIGGCSNMFLACENSNNGLPK